ncbi:MAG: hypothetical protein VCA35_15780 [Roseibacillus sp.]
MLPPVLLFICTSNVCRSRFAETLFKQAASQAALPLRAKSYGLAPHRVLEDSLSPYAESTLRSKGICLSLISLTKTPLCAQDLEKATRIIALNDRVEAREENYALYKATPAELAKRKAQALSRQ